MQRSSQFTVGIIFLVGCFCHAPLAGQAVSAETTEESSDELAISNAIDSYVRTFNLGDAKLLAKHWTPDGTFTTTPGSTFRGHQELETSFTVYFAEHQGAKIELPETTLTFISPNVTKETGIARVSIPGSEPSETQYLAIHVKTSDGWKIDSVQEQAVVTNPSLPNEHLRDLEWMVGSWIDTDENGLIESNCRWTTNRNFLVKTFKVYIEDRVDFEGTQVIGWDPYAEAIRSWTFDSDGGFGIGKWSGAGSHWSVRTLNVLPDGRQGSSTNTYDLIDENTIQFRSIGRQIDGELLPSIEPITVSRIPAN